MRSRPVAARASRMAAELASVPEPANATRSMPVKSASSCGDLAGLDRPGAEAQALGEVLPYGLGDELRLMAEQQDAEAHGDVDVLVAVHVGQARAPGRAGRERVQRLLRGAAEPDDGPAVGEHAAAAAGPTPWRYGSVRPAAPQLDGMRPLGLARRSSPTMPEPSGEGYAGAVEGGGCGRRVRRASRRRRCVATDPPARQVAVERPRRVPQPGQGRLAGPPRRHATALGQGRAARRAGSAWPPASRRAARSAGELGELRAERVLGEWRGFRRGSVAGAGAGRHGPGRRRGATGSGAGAGATGAGTGRGARAASARPSAPGPRRRPAPARAAIRRAVSSGVPASSRISRTDPSRRTRSPTAAATRSVAASPHRGRRTSARRRSSTVSQPRCRAVSSRTRLEYCLFGHASSSPLPFRYRSLLLPDRERSRAGPVRPVLERVDGQRDPACRRSRPGAPPSRGPPRHSAVGPPPSTGASSPRRGPASARRGSPARHGGPAGERRVRPEFEEDAVGAAERAQHGVEAHGCARLPYEVVGVGQPAPGYAVPSSPLTNATVRAGVPPAERPRGTRPASGPAAPCGRHGRPAAARRHVLRSASQAPGGPPRHGPGEHLVRVGRWTTAELQTGHRVGRGPRAVSRRGDTASIAPGASVLHQPARSAVSRMPSSSDRAPATHSAAYSPTLCPATADGRRRRAATAGPGALQGEQRGLRGPVSPAAAARRTAPSPVRAAPSPRRRTARAGSAAMRGVARVSPRPFG